MRRRQERLRSEILIVDRGGPGPAPEAAAAGSAGSLFGQGGEDGLPREDVFLRRADNNSVATVDAIRLRNLDRSFPRAR